jgi:myo-inositol-1(or 4)-monophosphatase
MSVDFARWQDVAIEAAQAAGFHALNHLNRRHEIAQKFEHDVKLQLDLECQAAAESIVRKYFPEHGILGEEGRRTVAREIPRWIIDPIDGTVNFFHGLPLWCSSVALQFEGRIVAGAVFMPELEELYTARIDGPALCNDKPIAPSRAARLADAMILTGLSKHIHENPVAFEMLKELTLLSQKVRVMGSAALDICHVACGKADGYIETGIYLWDVAAAGLVAERAGAHPEIIEELAEYRYRYICTNGKITGEVKDLLARFPAGKEPA